MWYADDSAAGSTVENIKRWWDELVEFGPLYGYYPNSSKTHILTKPDHVQSVRDAFKTTDITISTDGKGYLGGALGSTAFIKHFMESKIESWVDEVKTLSNIAKSQPHAAYAAFTHGLYSKWNYVLRVIDLESHSLSELLQPLETAIMSTFFSALTGQSPPGETIRKLLSLPTHLGGLSLVNPLDTSIEQHRVSKLISAPLVNRVIDQNESLEGCHLSQQRLSVTFARPFSFACARREEGLARQTSSHLASDVSLRTRTRTHNNNNNNLQARFVRSFLLGFHTCLKHQLMYELNCTLQIFVYNILC